MRGILVHEVLSSRSMLLREKAILFILKDVCGVNTETVTTKDTITVSLSYPVVVTTIVSTRETVIVIIKTFFGYLVFGGC